MRFCKIIFAALASAFLLLFVSFAIIQLPISQSYLIRQLAHHLEQKSGWAMEVGDLEGFFPFSFWADDVSIIKEDRRLELGKVKISLSPFALLNGIVDGRLDMNDYKLSVYGKYNLVEADTNWKDLQLEIDLSAYGVAELLHALVDLDCESERVLLQFTNRTIHAHQHVIDHLSAHVIVDTKNKSLLSLACSIDALPFETEIEASFDSNLQQIVMKIESRTPYGSALGAATVETASLVTFCQWHISTNQTPLEGDLSLQIVPKSEDGQLQAYIEAKGEIAPLLQFLLNDDTNAISGQAKLMLTICGKETFDVQGKLEIHHASYELLSTGAVFKEIDAFFEGNCKQLLLKQLQGIDSKGGTVSATGILNFDAARHFPFALFIDVEHATILHLDYAHGIGSGQLYLQGNFDQAVLGGTLNIDQATILLPKQAPPDLGIIEVTYINQPEDEALPKHFAATEDTWPLHMDLWIGIPSHAFVNGESLTSEWGGEIHVTGTTEDPLIHGTIQLIEGEYFFNGKSFKGKQGSIVFSGDPLHKTTLYALATQEIEDIRIEAIFKGPIYDPVLTMHSNPPMNEKEILSWILFHKGLKEITPFQKAELSQSIVTLSGGNEGDDPLSVLRRNFGIDRLDISSRRTEDNNAIGLRIGKYLSESLFVSLHKGINKEGNQVAIDAHLSKRVTMQAEIGDDAEGKMILKWKRDY